LITGVDGIEKGFGISNQLIQWSFLEYRDAQNLQKRVEGNLQRQTLFYNRGEDVDRDGNPDLCLYRVLGGPVKSLDPKVLLDPAKKQLDLPAELIKLSNGQGRKGEVVRQEDQITVVVTVTKSDPAKTLWESIMGIESGKGHHLIRSHIRGPIYRAGNDPIISQVRLGSDNEECLALMKSKETAVINITAIKDIKATGLEDEFVQNPHIVCFSIGNMDKRRDGAPQIKKRMKLDGAFVFTEGGPGKKRQAQVDRGRVESIDGVFQFDSELLVDIKGTSLGDENPGEIGIDPPIASFIGMGQGIAGNAAPKTHVIKSAFHRPKAGLDIAEAFAIGQLGESQTEELVVTRKAFDFVAAAIPPNAFSKFVKRQEIHKLRKDGRRGVHRSLLAVSGRKGDNNTKMRSNRLRPKPHVSLAICDGSKDISFQRWDATAGIHEKSSKLTYYDTPLFS